MARLAFLILLLVAVAACSPQSSTPGAEVIPTLASLPEEQPDLLGAERVAREFLEDWKAGNFEAMHGLLTFASQEATPLDSFVSLYQSAHDTMRLQSLDYQGNTLTRDGSVALFNYNVSFSAQLLGEFSDESRDLRLVMDERAGDWRVAWTPGDIFAEMGNGGRLRFQADVPSRANIYDRTGEQTLADQNGRVVTINVIREDIPDYPACLNTLAGALGKPVEEIQATLEARPPDWLMDMGTVEAATWEATNAQLTATCAATFAGRSVRNYANGPIAANIIGYVGQPDEAEIPAVQAAGFPQDAVLGRSGIEKTWDETLRGTPGGVLSIVTADGQVLREIARARTSPPQSVWLTIDIDLQREITEILANEYATQPWASTSNGASVVMMNVRTGEILAMVSYPSFDNNAFTTFPTMGRTQADAMVQNVQNDPRRPQLNRPALGAYPLGSVMKLVTSTAAADSGVYRLDERYTCTGVWSRDITRYDWRAGGHGTLTLPQAITQSCNPYYYEAGYRLDSVDPWILPTYARELGFGAPTGLTDVAEAKGLIVDPDWWRVNIGREWNFSESVNMAIGQGYLQVTPVQVTRMVAAIANGGTLYRPRLVSQVGLLGETPSFVAEPEAQGQVDVQPEVFEMVRQGMCDVTTAPYGTATHIFRDSPLLTIGICGKTGTAQAPPSDISHAWFASYAPRENPEVALVVMVENSGEGSGVAAPISRLIWEYYYFRDARP